MRALVALLVVVGLLYAPATRGLPVDWDDGVWMSDPVLALGPWDAVKLAFSTPRDAVYAPLLRLAFAVLRTPLAIHGASVALFLASIAGLHTVLLRIGLSHVTAVFALAVWALHPTKVECVAWITGLKDTLSLALLVAAAVVLLPHAVPSPRRIAIGTALGACALLTKAAVFPVPFALAIAAAPALGRAETVRRFGPSCAAGLLLAVVGAWCWEPQTWPPMPRVMVPLWVHGEFVAKLIPRSPAAITPIPGSPAGVALLGLVVLGAAALQRRRAIPLLAVWLLPLVPFLGVVPMQFWASDRHLLIPSLAPAVAVAALARTGWVPLAIAGFGAWLSLNRVPDWRASLPLWQAEVTRPGSHPARWHKLGMAQAKAGRFTEAVTSFDRALALDPGDRTTLARRLVASLAADGWTASDTRLLPALEPAPADGAAWQQAITALRRGGEAELAATAEAALTRAPPSR